MTRKRATHASRRRRNGVRTPPSQRVRPSCWPLGDGEECDCEFDPSIFGGSLRACMEWN